MAKRNLPHLAYNWISGMGALLAGVAFSAAALLLGLSVVSQITSPYIGIVVYILLPAIVVFGLVLIPIGMWRRSRWLKRREPGELPAWPRIDLNRKRDRNGVLVFVLGSGVFVLGSIVGVYKAYEYAESVSFCGKLCHTVMAPQYATHEISPHANVACTSCHVGPGVGWYARSKVRGLSRAYEVVRDSYPTPIPIPISDLKPTELECHHCHWPELFYGGRDRHFDNYMYDKDNTHWPIDMVVHIGGGDPAIDRTTGSHWYMVVGYKISYIARDQKRQDIPWVRATNRKTGEVTVYQDTNKPLSKKEIEAATPVTLDCVDCHNAPTHRFHTPDEAIDQALAMGTISPDLPNIKKVAVAAMAKSYENQQTAVAGIAKDIDGAYEKNHPDLYEKHRDEIQAAISQTQKRFTDNVFPTMKANWKNYPSNIGHLYSRGCFRCHLGDHASSSGETIDHGCSTCHDIMAQGSGSRAETASTLAGLSFEHPADIGGMWQEAACSMCHSGTKP